MLTRLRSLSTDTVIVGSDGENALPVVGEDALIHHHDEERTDSVKSSSEQLHEHRQRFVRHPRLVLTPL